MSSAPPSDTARLLASIDARLARLEAGLTPLTDTAAHGADALAAITDTVDDAVGRLSEAGVDVDERVRVALRLAERLTDPATAARLEQGLDIAEQLPGLVAGVTDTADGVAARLAAAGVDVDERIRVSLALAERLTDPRTAAQLHQALDLAEQLPGLVAGVTDTVDGVVARLSEAGVDVDERIRVSLGVLDRLTDPKAMTQLNRMLEILVRPEFLKVVSGDAVEIVGDASAAMVEARGGEAEPVGPFALLRSLKDPDVGRALSFGLRFARRFGRVLAR